MTETQQENGLSNDTSDSYLELPARDSGVGVEPPRPAEDERDRPYLVGGKYCSYQTHAVLRLPSERYIGWNNAGT